MYDPGWLLTEARMSGVFDKLSDGWLLLRMGDALARVPLDEYSRDLSRQECMYIIGYYMRQMRLVNWGLGRVVMDDNVYAY